MRMFVLVLALLSSPAIASTTAIMYRDPGCGCCEQWAAQVRKALGKAFNVVDASSRVALQARYGIRPNLRSCHTALIDGLAFEGHVPIEDMRRVLAARPRGVTGLAVGGMPLGSPGMEVPGQAPQRFVVYALGAGVPSVYARH
ncbi:MAG: DUF411 domain-containing protein [Sphingomonadaceae bacterium]|nr:DUF411 domain-containing protein [Sphingomonadaceae bacterium]